MYKRRIIVTLMALLTPGLLLAPVWRLAGLGADEDDILYYFPSRTFLHETIQAGHWPWLNPWTGLDRPYVADPQSAIWYPFTWLFALLSPLTAYPLCLWAHYSLAFWGMYRLLRSRALQFIPARTTVGIIPGENVADTFQENATAGLDWRAALFGALAFTFCGFMLAHRAHFTMQQAAAWMPWVFWRLLRYADAGGPRRLLFAALVAAMQCFAGHVQIAALTALGLLVYLLASRGLDWLALRRWLLVWVGAAGLFAIQILPTFLYLRVCTRSERELWMFVENSWRPASALGWLLPMLFGQRTPNFFDQAYWGPSHQVEQFSYSGIVPLLLAALAVRNGWRGDAFRRPWFVLAIFALLTALGEFGPVCPILYWLPGASVFRVPARAMLLFHLAVAALAAGAFHDLGAALTPARARLRAAAQRWTCRPVSAALLLVGISLAAIVMTLPLMDAATRQAAFTALQPWRPAVWIPLLMLVGGLAAAGFIARQWKKPVLLWLFFPLTALDLAVIGWTIDVPAGQNDPRALLAPPEHESWLQSVRGSSERLWTVADTLGPYGIYTQPVRKGVANTNIFARVAALTDYGPLQPLSLDRRFHFKPWGMTEDAPNLLMDTAWMRPFNIGWILACDPALPEPESCELITTTSAGWRLYRNPTPGGMAFFENASQTGVVRFFEQTPYSFTLRTDTWPASRTAARVVISKLALPGWRALHDGKPLAVETAFGALLAVTVPAGQVVEMQWSYFPPGLLTGAIISGFSLMALVFFAFGQPLFQRIARGKKRKITA